MQTRLLELPAIAVGKLWKYGAAVSILLLVFFAAVAAGRRMGTDKFAQRIRQLEKELAKRERANEKFGRLGKFIDQSPNPFLRISGDGTILYRNKSSKALLKGWGYWKALPSSSYWYHYIPEALDSGHPSHGEIKCGDRIFSLTFVPFVDSGYVNVHALDVTEHKRAEQRLRKKGEEFWAIAGYGYDLEGWHGLDGRLAWANPAVKRITGYSIQECMAMPDYPLPLIYEEDRQDVGKVIHRFVKERTSGNDLPFRMRRKDGTLVWVAMSWQPIYNSKGVYQGIRSSIRDIDERKRAEEALRQSEDRFHSLVQTAGSAIIFLSPDHRVLEWNSEAERIYGWKRDEILGKDYVDLLVPAGARQVIAADIEKVLAGQPSRGFENPVRTRDGTDRILLWNVVRVLDTNGEPTGIVAIGQDITERKEAERQIRQHNAVLSAINEVFQKALTCETDTEVAQTCLAVAERLTGSKFGFVGEVNQRGLFDTIAISNPGWDACRMPNSQATRLIRDMEIRGIWSRVLKDQRSHLVNDPRSHPDRVGTPEGHPPINCFLGVPLKQGDKTIGIIGLANKDLGYELSDQEAVEALSIAFVEALMRKRAEERVRPR